MVAVLAVILVAVIVVVVVIVVIVVGSCVWAGWGANLLFSETIKQPSIFQYFHNKVYDFTVKSYR